MITAGSTRLDSDRPDGGADVEGDDVPAPALKEETQDMQADLPPLPEDIHDSVAFVRGLDPAKFYADPRRNPSGRDFSATERIRLSSEVAIARNQIDILEKEIQIICADNMDRMREEGDYVEYASGERPASAGPGVVSFGEMTEHESRLFFLLSSDERPFQPTGVWVETWGAWRSFGKGT
jgi:hypothetical protein